MSPTAPDRRAAEQAIADLIRALGLSARTEPELEQTPERVARLFEELLVPAAELPEVVTFPAPRGSDQLVTVRDLPFYSLCVHHFVPFFGHGHVAYLPGKSLMGISGAPRVLEHFARRPQLQERLAEQVADHLEKVLQPRGIAVVLRARHLCMELRGVRRRGWVETRVVRGELTEPRWAPLLPETTRRRRGSWPAIIGDP